MTAVAQEPVRENYSALMVNDSSNKLKVVDGIHVWKLTIGTLLTSHSNELTIDRAALD
jgi:hypothetical protein